MTHRAEIITLAVLSTLFVAALTRLYFNQAEELAQVERDYAERRALNLDAGTTTRALTDLLADGGYCSDDDARFIAAHIVARLSEGHELPNLGALNLEPFTIDAATARHHGGRRLQARLDAIDERLGLDDNVRDCYAHGIPDSLTATVGEAVITVDVSRPDTTRHGLSRLWARLTGRASRPAAPTLVRLKEHRLDTVYSITARGDSVPAAFTAAERVIAYAFTDAHGRATFHVPPGGYYSVLPIKENCEYGASRGTRGTPLDGNASFSFVERDLMITPFGANTYRQLKANHALTVRTPQQYRHGMTVAAVVFLLAWWLALLALRVIDTRLQRRGDRMPLLLLMAITGVGSVTMFAIAAPLTDRLLGTSMATGLALGVAALVALSGINIAKFFNSRSRLQMGFIHFDFTLQALRWATRPFSQKLDALRIKGPRRVTAGAVAKYYLGLAGAVVCLPVSAVNNLRKRFVKRPLRLPDGFGYLLLAVLLSLLLYVFGTGPAGSDAHVNLFFFQPSELSKLLVVVFIAAFFARNATRLHAFAGDITPGALKWQLRTMGWVIAGILFLLAMYLKLLSDMGPALVLIVTFILLYSLARRDFVQLIAGIASFIALLAIGHLINPEGAGTMLLLATAWFIAWIAGWWLTRRRLYESAIFFNLLLTAFVLGGDLLTALGQDTLGRRLLNRTAMVGHGAWNNDIAGGDQVAQGIWSLATGGWNGQGLGHGNANLVPAFHTDMVFTSIGEVMGLGMLIAIIVAMVLLLRRCLQQAYRAGHPFAFYLAAGIAIVTGVQFFVIVLGSMGIIPLTGVSVPLLSYGASSLVLNLAAFGLVIAVSRERATESQRRERRKWGNVTATAIATFAFLGLVVIGYLFYYQVIKRDSFLIKPAFITNLNGERGIEYNPRIALLASRLDMGNVTDRNGLLVATGDRDTLLSQATRYAALGVDLDSLRLAANRPARRYYPLGDHLFFMLGDLNTLAAWSDDEENNPHGYMADLRHLSLLRGYDNRDSTATSWTHLVSDNHRLSPFLPATHDERDALVRDYTALLPMLKAGLHSDLVEQWNGRRHERDLQLTLDAKLQVTLQNDMATAISANNTYAAHRHLRASVVVLDARQGDLLTSACYPLPDQDILQSLAEQGITYYTERSRAQRPYTERDLGLTFFTFPGSSAKVISAMAAFMRGGDTPRDSYHIEAREAVHHGEPAGEVDMRRAIRESSNCYFVHLVNRHDLYPQLGEIYAAAGLRLHERGRQAITPYTFDYRHLDSLRRDRFLQEIAFLGYKGRQTYDFRMERRRHSDSQYDWCMNWHQTAMAWGQGALEASPLAMARIAAIVANDGNLAPTRYILKLGGENLPPATPVRIMPDGTASQLRGYMQAEADKHLIFNLDPENRLRVGGKTGTPERVYRWSRSGKNNDAWYVCFIYSRSLQHHLAVAVRLERTDGRLSGLAVDFMKDVVLPALRQTGYDPIWK